MTTRNIANTRRHVTRWLLASAVALCGLSMAQTAPATGGMPVAALLPAPPAPGSTVAPVMQTLDDDTLATIRKHGRLRVGVITVEPMVMRNARGEISGLSIDVMRRRAQEMDDRFDMLATGLWMTTERAMVINFTGPTVNEVAVVANGDATAALVPALVPTLAPDSLLQKTP